MIIKCSLYFHDTLHVTVRNVPDASIPVDLIEKPVLSRLSTVYINLSCDSLYRSYHKLHHVRNVARV